MAKQTINSPETFSSFRAKLNSMFTELFGTKANIGADGFVTEVESIEIDAVTKGVKVAGVQKYNIDATRMLAILDSGLTAKINAMTGGTSGPKTLTAVTIQGPVSVNEGTTTTYSLLGTYSDATTSIITTGVTWAATNGYVVTNGSLVVPSNSATGDNTTTTLTASANGVQDTHQVSIVDTTSVGGPSNLVAFGTPTEMSNYTRTGNNFTYDQTAFPTQSYGGVDYAESFAAGASGVVQMDIDAIGRGALIVSGGKGIHGTGGTNAMSLVFGSNGQNILVSRNDDTIYTTVSNLSLTNTKARIRVTATQLHAEYSINGGTSWVTLASTARSNLKSYVTVFSDFAGAKVITLLQQGATV